MPYDAKRILIDIDGDTLGSVALPTKRFALWLGEYDIPHHLYHSGNRGYHLAIPKEAVGYERAPDLDSHMGRFVRRLIRRFDTETEYRLEIDHGLYQRHHKIRLPGCPRVQDNPIRGADQFKRIITPSQITAQNRWGDVQAKTRGQIPLFDTDTIDPVPMLQRLWEETEDPIDPVDILRPSGGVGAEQTFSGEVVNLDDLTEAVEDLPSAQETSGLDGTRKIRLSCIHPDHRDLDPSAAYWPDGGGYNCLGCGHSAGASWVADQLGVTLEWDIDTSTDDEEEDPTPLSEAREELDRRMRGALYGQAHTVFQVPVGVGKSYTAASLAEEAAPVAVMEEGEDARAIEAIDPDDVDPAWSEDPDDHDWLPDWCDHAEWIDWEPNRRVAFCVDAYDLADEQVERMDDALSLNRPWELEPRCISEDPPRGVPTQSRKEEIERRQRYAEARASVCVSCPLNPHSDAYDEDREPCQFHERYDEMVGREKSSFFSKNYLDIGGRFEELTRKHDVLVCDEDIIPHIIGTETFDMSDLRDARQLTDDVPSLECEGGSLGVWEMIQRLTQEELPVPAQEDQDGVDVIERWYDTADWDGSWTVDDSRAYRLTDDAFEGDFGLGSGAMEHLTEVTRLINYLASNRVLDVTYKWGTLFFRDIVSNEHLDDCQIIVLDASVSEDDWRILQHLTREVPAYTDEDWEAERQRRIDRLEQQWRADHDSGIFFEEGAEMPDFSEEVPEEPPEDAETRMIPPEMVEISCQNGDTIIYQDPTCSWSRSSKKDKLEKHDDPDFGDFDRYQALVDFIDGILHESGPDELGIITTKPAPGSDGGFLSRLLDDVDADLGIEDHVMWFGNLRGMDSFKGRKHLVIIGDPSLAAEGYVQEMVRWEGDVVCQGRWSDVMGEWRNQSPPVIRDDEFVVWDGSYRLRYTCIHPVRDCPCVEEHGWDVHDHVWSRTIRREIYQAIGRVRGLEFDSNIYLLSAAHPGRDALSQFRHELHGTMLSSKKVRAQLVSTKGEEVWQEAHQRANDSHESIRSIASDLGLGRKQVKALVEDDAVRHDAKRRAWELRQEGHSYSAVGDALGCSRQTASNYVSDWEDIIS